MPLVACGSSDPDDVPWGLSEEKPDLASFFRRLGMTLPPATVERYRYVAWADDSAEVVLVMAEADWTAMRNAPPLKDIPPDPWSSENAVGLPANKGNGGIVAAPVPLPAGQAMRVGYAPAAPGRVRVYLFWNEM